MNCKIYVISKLIDWYQSHFYTISGILAWGGSSELFSPQDNRESRVKLAYFDISLCLKPKFSTEFYAISLTFSILLVS